MINCFYCGKECKNELSVRIHIGKLTKCFPNWEKVYITSDQLKVLQNKSQFIDILRYQQKAWRFTLDNEVGVLGRIRFIIKQVDYFSDFVIGPNIFK